MLMQMFGSMPLRNTSFLFFVLISLAINLAFTAELDPKPAADQDIAKEKDAALDPDSDQDLDPDLDPDIDSLSHSHSHLSQCCIDSGMVQKDSNQVSKKLYTYVAYPMLQIVTWPLENILAPAVKFSLYPYKPPLRYLLNNNVIDRTISLISFGENNQLMAYPTLNLAPGTSSYTGLTLRENSLFGSPNHTLVGRGNIYVNGDWRFRTYITSKKIYGTDFTSKYSIQFIRVKNSKVNQPGTPEFWFYSDNSNVFFTTFTHPLFGQFFGNTTFNYRDNNFGKAPPQPKPLLSDFFKDEKGNYNDTIRGLSSSWVDRTITMGITRDTRTNENIPLAGSNFYANYSYHLTDAKHDFHNWETSWTGYYKLGKEKYEISSAEERAAGGLSMEKVLKKIEYEKLKKELFNRKVLVFHTFLAQSYEVAGNHMPVYGLQTLGNDTPLRGYSGSRFRDYTIASFSTEYRFPILRLVDGMMFNEYGVFGRSWDKIDYIENLRNSWGFGIRVRRPDIYLFRLQLGFHGGEGIVLNMSVDEPI